jgi:hypothetical protein
MALAWPTARRVLPGPPRVRGGIRNLVDRVIRRFLRRIGHIPGRVPAFSAMFFTASAAAGAASFAFFWLNDCCLGLLDDFRRPGFSV